MLERTNWNKFHECIFESFEFARVKQGQFQNFQKSRGLSSCIQLGGISTFYPPGYF